MEGAMLRKLFAIASAASAAAGAVAYGRYLRDIRQIRSGVERGGTLVETAAGTIEYAEEGSGEPLLMIHGAGGGYDQGLLVGRDLGPDFRIIAPSRFGYLGTPVPQDCSPVAQADAHAALLDRLGVAKCVVAGVSAGAPSAIELALRYPERVSALILLVPRTYDPSQSIGVDEAFQSQIVLRLVEASADFLFWTAMRLSRGSVVRFLGVPPELEAAASDEDRERVTDIMRSILPLSKRVRGITVDSSTNLEPWPLDRLRMPVLIVSAKDDLYRTLPGARFTASRIKQAELKVLESGGHLMLGQSGQVRQAIAEFLKDRRPPAGRKLAGRVADGKEPAMAGAG
jgi:2-hydroxy-6-oxonona-2,4-dienedioate hydrolase